MHSPQSWELVRFGQPGPTDTVRPGSHLSFVQYIVLRWNWEMKLVTEVLLSDCRKVLGFTGGA